MLIYSDSFFCPPGILNPKHELTVLGDPGTSGSGES